MKQKKMLPFPGGKVGAKRGHLTELTSAQQTWLITYFPIATNKVLFTTMGISEGLLKRFAVELVHETLLLFLFVSAQLPLHTFNAILLSSTGKA